MSLEINKKRLKGKKKKKHRGLPYKGLTVNALGVATVGSHWAQWHRMILGATHKDLPANSLGVVLVGHIWAEWSTMDPV